MEITRELKAQGCVIPDEYFRKRKEQANLKKFLFANWDLLTMRVLRATLPLWIKDIAWLCTLPVDWDEEKKLYATCPGCRNQNMTFDNCCDPIWYCAKCDESFEQDEILQAKEIKGK